MEKLNQKIFTLAIGAFAVLAGYVFHAALKGLASIFGVFARIIENDLILHGLPVVIGFAVFFALFFNNVVKSWGEEVINEIRRVQFPSRKDTSNLTILVLVMVVISGFIISIFDFVSGYVINVMIR